MEEHGPRVLFVDDELWFMEGIVDTLEAEGFQVFLARTATQALETLETENVDAILLDIMMQAGPRVPDHTFGREAGVELCRIIREEMKLGVPVVCLTVVTDDDILRILMNLGARILVKPTATSEIVTALKESIG